MKTPTHINVNGEEYCLNDLFKAIDQSHYAEELSKRTRFGRFQLEEVPNDLWERILGYDVNNYKHQKLVDKITCIFLKNCDVELDEFEFALMRVLARTHDLGEYAVGDIALPHKTEGDEIEELKHFQRIFLDILTPVMGPNSVILLYNISLIMKGVNEKLANMFNTIETIGYIRTAITAWEKKNDIPVIELTENLDSLAREVIKTSLNVLIERIDDYPNISIILQEHNETIQEILYS